MKTDATKAIVRVGDGRGFIVEIQERFTGRLVITAAHCLPHLPPAHPGAYREEITYGKLLGPLDEEPNIAAECVFVDPVADIAVLRCPASDELYEDWEAYMELTERGKVRVGLGPKEGEAWVLMLSGQWSSCALEKVSNLGGLFIDKVKVRSGMSGSPIIDKAGSAIGVISVGAGCFPNPSLAGNLPGWLLRQFASRKGGVSRK
jgi:hypothetical protein